MKKVRKEVGLYKGRGFKTGKVGTEEMKVRRRWGTR